MSSLVNTITTVQTEVDSSRSTTALTESAVGRLWPVVSLLALMWTGTALILGWL